jgi:Family of unknown function (DUF6399)
MSAPQPTAAAAAPQDPFRWSRADTARILHAFHNQTEPDSGRAFAQQAGLPNATLHYWRQRQQQTAAEPALAHFFDSPQGLALLKRLLLALHLVFPQASPIGIRPVCRFLELAGLAPFVAASYGVHQRLATLLQELLGQYEQQERQRLAVAMPPKTISVCEDENFHGTQPCLVAMEPLSNFLLVESYQPKRDAETWNATLQAATAGLPVTVVQVTSDLAKGLVAHARDGLGAQHSPDLMHVQKDILQGTCLPLRQQLEQAQQELQSAGERTRHWRERYQRHQAGIRAPGRPPDFEREIRWAQQTEHYWSNEVRRREQRQEALLEAVRGLGDDYHPFDQHSGQPVSGEHMQERLEKRFAQIEQLAEEAALSEPCRQKVAKARRVLPRLVAAVAWFWHSVRLLVESLALPAGCEQAIYEQLLPGLYWVAAAERARTAAEKLRLRSLAKRCLALAWAAGGVLNNLGEDVKELLRKVCVEGAGRFVRSSSCVEGRNGQLSLFHHGCHALSVPKLKALTVLHNYFLERGDGTTAAERFFGQKPRDLFEWLLERFPDPPRPAKRLQKTGASAS